MLSMLAAVVLSQCATGITDNAQNLCGTKTFPEGVVIGVNSGDYQGAVIRGSGVLLDGPYSYIQTTGGRTLYMRDTVASGSSSPSFYLQTTNARTASDEVLRITNGTNPVLIIYGDGRMVIGTIRNYGHSGDPALQAAVGAYLGLSSDLPLNYQGEHGALSVSNATACTNEAFNLFQLSNGVSGSGARTDYAFNVTCLGGRYSRATVNSYSLPLCNNALGEPPEPNNRYGACTNLANPSAPNCNFGPCGVLVDGGYCYDWTTYYGPDGGYAKNGTVFDFVTDVGEGCQCVSTKYDGGVSPAGWFKQSDRTECRP